MKTRITCNKANIGLTTMNTDLVLIEAVAIGDITLTEHNGREARGKVEIRKDKITYETLFRATNPVGFCWDVKLIYPRLVTTDPVMITGIEDYIGDHIMDLPFAA